MRLLVAVPAFSLATVLVCSCGGSNAASQLAKAPEYSPKDQTKCGVEKSQARPLIVEWTSADHQELESKVRRGLVAVSYHGCVMDVLERCSIPATYGYLGTTRAQDQVVIRNEDELYAKLPVGAAGLEAKLQRGGQLTVDMNLVGRYEAQKMSVSAAELQGDDCASATHFIYAVSVGAFDFYAGADASVGGGVGVGGVGAGGNSQATRETLTKNGDPDACAKASTSDKTPPDGCGALIRIEVVPLGAAKALAPTCPDGTQWDGSQCVGRKVVTQVDCPAGTTWNGAACAPPIAAAPAPQAPAQPAQSGAMFDRGAASAVLGDLANRVVSCKSVGGPTGDGHIAITFNPDGTVQMAVVDQPPFAGTAVGGCVAGKFRSARIPAFSGGPLTVGKRFNIP
jgi:hypothetical protein